MKLKEKDLFLFLCIGSVASFLLCGYSLISCFALADTSEGLGSHILEISYLFMHLIVCAIIFYLAFRAMKFGSFFVKNVMFDGNGQPVNSKRIVFGVLSGLLFIIFIYSFIQGITMSLPLAAEIGKVVWHDIMNASFILSIIFIVFVIYPIFPYNNDNRHAMDK